VRRSDEREREQQAMRHEEAMAQESRLSEQQLLDHELQLARLQARDLRAAATPGGLTYLPPGHLGSGDDHRVPLRPVEGSTDRLMSLTFSS
jgi:hypothetical protein